MNARWSRFVCRLRGHEFRLERGWTGFSLHCDRCLERLAQVDTASFPHASFHAGTETGAAVDEMLEPFGLTSHDFRVQWS